MMPPWLTARRFDGSQASSSAQLTGLAHHRVLASLSVLALPPERPSDEQCADPPKEAPVADGLPTITLWQPWASLVTLGIKTIETRSWAAPERLIGQRIGIHAAARPPIGRVGTYEVCRLMDGSYEAWSYTADDLHPGLTSVVARHPLPLGVLLGTVRLTACVPMVECIPPQNEWREPWDILTLEPWPIRTAWRGWGSAETIQAYADQRPFGDFAPGRFAWLLDDPVPTTERCPAGCEPDPDGIYRTPSDPAPVAYGSLVAWTTCTTCDGAGRCEPIPAKGTQRVWYWTPEGGPRG